MKNIFVVQLVALIPFALLLFFALGVLLIPALRREKCRLLVDLIEGGLRRGSSPEKTLTALTHLNDPSLGYGIYSVCWRVERGQSLPEALSASAFFPREMAQIFRAGYQLGSIEGILPAAREAAAPKSVPRSGTHYLILSATALSPLLPAVLLVLGIFVYPRLGMLFSDLGEGSLPLLTQWTFSMTIPFAYALLAFSALLYLGVFLQATAAPLLRWAWVERLKAQVPWVKLRLRQRFASMLAKLLDASIPESKAVQTAALTVGNAAYQPIAERIQTELSGGKSLPEALRWVDATGQLGWRLRNAGSALTVSAAFAGWLELMEARAFKSHQTWVHLLGVGLLLLVGLVVAITMISIFLVLIGLIEAGVLW